MATVLNECVQSAHAQIPFFLWANGDDLHSHLTNAVRLMHMNVFRSGLYEYDSDSEYFILKVIK